MPRRKRAGLNAKGRNKGDGQYMPIPYTMARSVAFRALGGNALKVFIELRCRYNAQNNGQLSLSFQDAADLLGMGKSSVKRAFDELTEKGFVIKRREGHWYGRKAAEYIVTDQSFEGHLPTRNWQRWRPPTKAKKQKSVPARYATPSSVPSEYRSDSSRCREGTRHGISRGSDGAALVPPIVSCGGAVGDSNSNREALK